VAGIIFFFFFSLLFLPPDGWMMKACVPVQPGWGKTTNRGRHTTDPDDPMERYRGLRAPSTGMPIGQEKGTGASLTHEGVAWPKVVVVVVVQR
jgi:hypothetical protein